MAHPGGMQRAYLNLWYRKLYGTDDVSDEVFFRHDFVLVQAVMAPWYATLTWLLFRDRRWNWAEMLVFNLYMLSLVFLALVPINAVKLLFPDYDNRYVEVLFLSVYITATNLHFFREASRLFIILRSIIMLAIAYLSSQLVQDLLKPLMV